jgi:hypothetical protein
MAPSDALIQYVIQHYHLATTDRPSRYQIRFLWKANSAQIASGILSLPSRADCINAMNAAQASGQQPGVAGPPRFQPTVGQPWQPQPQQPVIPPPQPPYYMPPGYGFAPAPPQPSVPPEMMQMMGGMMTELIAAAREGRQPVMPQPGVAAAPGGMSESDVDRIAARVAVLMGAGRPAAAPMAPPTPATPPPPPASSATSGLNGLAEKMVNEMLGAALKSVGSLVDRSIKQSMGVGGLPNQVEEEDEPAAPPAEIVPPEKPEDAVPWTVADAGGTWPDGRNVKVAINKESNGIDWTGVAFANPVLAEKAMGIVENIGMAIKDAVVKYTAGGGGGGQNPAAQMVREIPAGARDAGVGSVPPPPPPPPPAGSGWEAP